MSPMTPPQHTSSLSSFEAQVSEDLHLLRPLRPILQEMNISLEQSVRILRYVGYGLLILVLLDIASFLLPLKAQDPRWLFQTIGQLVDKSVFLLLALAFIFFGARQYRSMLGLLVSKLLSWGSLIMGGILIGLIPLVLISTFRIDTLNTFVFNQQLDQQNNQAAAMRQEIQRIETVEELLPLQQLMTPDQVAGNNEATWLDRKSGQEADIPELSPGMSLAEVRNTLLNQLEVNQKNLQANLAQNRAQQRLGLRKTSVKFCLGALVSAVMFILLWRSTAWAKQFRVSV